MRHNTSIHLGVGRGASTAVEAGEGLVDLCGVCGGWTVLRATLDVTPVMRLVMLDMRPVTGSNDTW